MKREVNIALSAILVVAIALVTVYYFSPSSTGFAVFNQQSQSDFNGTYDNVVYDANLSAIVLQENQTVGTYTSQIFDASNDSLWNNLTWVGTGDLSFEVRACGSSDCVNDSFETVDLSDLNLTGRYFQYMISFDSTASNDTLSLESVNLDYSLITQNETTPENVTTLSISQPSGSKNFGNIPLEFTATGTDLSCWYDVRYASDNSVYINVQQLSGCEDVATTFSVSQGDAGEDYVVTVYVNGSGGFVNKSVQVSITGAKTTTETTTTTTTQTETTQQEQTQAPTTVTEISLGDIPGFDLDQGATKDLTLSVQNTGTIAVSACVLTTTGDASSFATVNSGPQDISPGTGASYSLSVNVPGDAEPGAYSLAFTVACTETTGSKTLGFNVIKKDIDFNITNVQRTRSNRVSIDYTLKDLSGEDQEIEMFFSIKDGSGTEVGNATQNRSINANQSDDFRTNININESLLPVNETTGEPIETDLTLSVNLNSQTYSSSVLEPITLGAITGSAIFGGVGTGSVIVIVILVIVLSGIFFVARKLRKTGKFRLKSSD